MSMGITKEGEVTHEELGAWYWDEEQWLQVENGEADWEWTQGWWHQDNGELDSGGGAHGHGEGVYRRPRRRGHKEVDTTHTGKTRVQRRKEVMRKLSTK